MATAILLDRPTAPPDQGGAYRAFLASKAQFTGEGGFAPLWLPEALFDFQQCLADWTIRRGRAAVFIDCGMGKSPIQLVWAENVARHTNRPVLILTPLAVAQQMVREGEKFGVECHLSRDGRFPAGARVVVANYEKLHLFDSADFAGAAGDESSILKAFDGIRRAQITEFFRTLEYRLLCTATAAPNDYIELGTHSEALGELGYMDMLGRFFKNDNRMGYLSAGEGGKWRFRGHAERDFWRWVCSWSRAARRPSDLGFDDARFVLPPLETEEHVVSARFPAPGRLFDTLALTQQEQLEERRRTVQERCEKAAALVADTARPAIAWCHLNDEGDLLERLIQGAVQIAGADDDEAKEERFAAFISGQARVLVSKPKVAGFGLNLQHCAHMTFFPSHSFEQQYQAIRRCWRFGQERPVKVDMVTSEGQAGVLANLQRKAAQAERQFARLTEHINEALGINRPDPFRQEVEAPRWL